MQKVIIYTDGACSGNPGPGGWGALLQYQDISKEIFGYAIDTTNNRMEMEAVIQALRHLKYRCIVEIYTDSRYIELGITKWIHNWIKNNWRSSNNILVKNIDLWQYLYIEVQKHDITWYWVKGHDNNTGNMIADKLAVRGKQVAKSKI